MRVRALHDGKERASMRSAFMLYVFVISCHMPTTICTIRIENFCLYMLSKRFYTITVCFNYKMHYIGCIVFRLSIYIATYKKTSNVC